MPRRRSTRSKHRLGDRTSRVAPGPPQAGGLSSWPVWLTQVAACWIALAAGSLALAAFIPGTALLNYQLPTMTRLSLAAREPAALLPAVAGIAGMVFLTGRLGARSGTAALRWLIAGVQALVVWLAVLVYGASWASFWQTGVFVDREALVFWAVQPIQVFHWVYPPFAASVLVATIAGAIAVGYLIPRWVARRSPNRQQQVVGGAAVAAGICVAGAALSIAIDPRTQTPREPDAVSFAMVGASPGPLSHLAGDLREWVWPSAAPGVAANSDVRIIRRPVVSMDQYLVGVDRAAFRPWNVVLVQVESLRSDQLRAYGGTRDVMPTLDALARESRVFTQAYIQASHSNYTDLVPLSSQYPLRTREMYTYPENPPYPRVLIYDVLKALGYRTAIFSSQNEHWGGMLNYHRPSSLDRFFHAATFAGPTYTPWEDTGFSEWVKETNGAGSVDDRHTMDEAIRWIETVAGAPFFLHMNLQSSHLPYVVPKEFRRRFGPDEIDFTIMWNKFPRDRVDVVKDRYADSLFYADTQIARLFAHLRDRGLWDRTIFVIGGDNGEAFFEHGFAAHASWLFDEVVKVPMLIRAPGLPRGTDDRPAMFLDVAPTVLALLGLPAHPGFQGVSLLEANPDRDRSLFMVAQTPSANESAIVRGGFKLHVSEDEGRYFLNDLVADPGETTDVAAVHPELARTLAGRLRRWRDEQLAYYADAARQAREYPPVLEE